MIIRPQRRHLRYRGYDYATPAAYFVTTVTARRAPILGRVTATGVVLSAAGHIVDSTWRAMGRDDRRITLECFVIMPDHVHAIVRIAPAPPGAPALPLTRIIGWAKSRSTHAINVRLGTPGKARWQVSFHERIIRTSDALRQITRYIERNPAAAWQALARLRNRRSAAMLTSDTHRRRGLASRRADRHP